MPAFIDDGYTLDGYLLGVEDLDIEAVEFNYRPATTRENTAWLQNRESLPGEVRADRDAAFLSDHLVSWSLTMTRAGKPVPVPITPENCGRLHHQLAGRLYDVVSGYRKSDPKPSQKAADRPNVEDAKGN